MRFRFHHRHGKLTLLFLHVGVGNIAANLQLILEEARGELLVVELAVAVLVASLEDIVQSL